MKCTLYDDLRGCLFSNVSNMCPNFYALSDEDQFIYIMSASGEVSKELASYCFYAFEKRSLIDNDVLELSLSQNHCSPVAMTTRSGRNIKRPVRMNL